MRQVLFHTPIGKPEKKHFVSHRSGNRLSKPLRTVRSGLRYAKTVRLKSPLLQAYLRPGKATMGQEKRRIPVTEGTYSPRPIRQGRGGLPVPAAPLWAVPSPRLVRQGRSGPPAPASLPWAAHSPRSAQHGHGGLPAQASIPGRTPSP